MSKRMDKSIVIYIIMIKIKVFTDFISSTEIKNIYINLYNLLENSKIYNKKYIFVDDDEEYTHAIIINKAMPEINISKENVIGLAYEPYRFLCLNEIFINYTKKHIGKYYIGSHSNNLGEPFIDSYSYITHTRPLKNINKKNKMMSIMVSNKIYAPGHKYRHLLVKEILKTDLPIDIWGRGVKYYTNDNRIKSVFKDIEPYEHYKFHIAIENFITPHYFSEKIINPLLFKTTPIYIGCQNIDEYLNNKVIKLTGDLKKDIELLTEICKNPENYEKEINQKEILDIVNIENLIVKEFL